MEFKARKKATGGSNSRSWQVLAIDIKKYLNDCPSAKLGQIFKLCKLDERTAKFAFNECQELNKPFLNYWFKVYWSIKKRQKLKTFNFSPKRFIRATPLTKFKKRDIM